MVDGPRDLRLEITSRAIGLELLRGALKTESTTSLMKSGVHVTEGILEKERNLQPNERGRLRSLTRWNLQKVLRFRQPPAMAELNQKVGRYIVRAKLHISYGKKDHEYNVHRTYYLPSQRHSMQSRRRARRRQPEIYQQHPTPEQERHHCGRLEGQ
jgi:hypothetical protein